jgi:hypothetical protein
MFSSTAVTRAVYLHTSIDQTLSGFCPAYNYIVFLEQEKSKEVQGIIYSCSNKKEDVHIPMYSGNFNAYGSCQ